jgi:hypothetical protein
MQCVNNAVRMACSSSLYSATLTGLPSRLMLKNAYLRFIGPCGAQASTTERGRESGTGTPTSVSKRSMCLSHLEVKSRHINRKPISRADSPLKMKKITKRRYQRESRTPDCPFVKAHSVQEPRLGDRSVILLPMMPSKKPLLNSGSQDMRVG